MQNWRYKFREVLIGYFNCKQGGSVWIERGGSSFAVVIPLGHVFRGSEASETIDIDIFNCK